MNDGTNRHTNSRPALPGRDRVLSPALRELVRLLAKKAVEEHLDEAMEQQGLGAFPTKFAGFREGLGYPGHLRPRGGEGLPFSPEHRAKPVGMARLTGMGEFDLHGRILAESRR